MDRNGYIHFCHIFPLFPHKAVCGGLKKEWLFSYCLILFFTINSEKQSLPVRWSFCLSVPAVDNGVSFPLCRT